MTRIEKDIVEFVQKEFNMSHAVVTVGNKSKTLNSLILEFLELQRIKNIVGDSTKDLEKELAGVSSMVVQTGSLMCCCSYYQKNTKQNRSKNILIKQDQFPTLQEVQDQLEIDLGFEVEEVVLINWKEVSKEYEL